MLPLFLAGAGLATGVASLVMGANRDAKQNQYNQRQYADYVEDRDYTRALQQQIFKREDTAMQRALQDYTAAGYSPLAAVGNEAGAGAIVSGPSSPSLTATNHTGEALGQMSNQLYSVSSQMLAQKHQEKMALQQQTHEQNMAESGRAHDRNMADLNHRYSMAEKEQDFFNSMEMLQSSQAAQKALQDADIEARKYLQDAALKAGSEAQQAGFQHDKDMHQLDIDTASQQESALARLAVRNVDLAAKLLDKVGLTSLADGIRSNPELRFYVADIVRSLEELPVTVDNYQNMVNPVQQSQAPAFRSSGRYGRGGGAYPIYKFDY